MEPQIGLFLLAHLAFAVLCGYLAVQWTGRTAAP